MFSKEYHLIPSEMVEERRQRWCLFGVAALPAEIFVASIVVVCMIVAGLYTALFSALKLLL